MVLAATSGVEMGRNHKNSSTLGIIIFVLCLPHISTYFMGCLEVGGGSIWMQMTASD